MFIEKKNSLVTTLVFKNFKEAFSFMTEVALVSEQQNHHPNWTNSWRKVVISLSTNDAGLTITEKDHKLAKSIEKISGKYQPEIL